jgi:hypothetical protein
MIKFLLGGVAKPPSSAMMICISTGIKWIQNALIATREHLIVTG